MLQFVVGGLDRHRAAPYTACDLAHRWLIWSASAAVQHGAKPQDCPPCYLEGKVGRPGKLCQSGLTSLAESYCPGCSNIGCEGGIVMPPC